MKEKALICAFSLNYLAHAYLSFENPEWLVGQFIADDVKGKKYLDYPPGIQQGILLHRFVDSYTDTSAVCLELRHILSAELGLYTSVAMDVFFDHILAVRWNDYSAVPRREFISNVYKILAANTFPVPGKMGFIIGKMAEMDWLGRYATMEGTALTLRQMASRVPKGAILEKAPAVLKDHLKKINETFEIFFPQLISASEFKLDTFAT